MSTQKHTESFYKQLIEASPDWFLILDKDANILFSSDAENKFTGIADKKVTNLLTFLSGRIITSDKERLNTYFSNIGKLQQQSEILLAISKKNDKSKLKLQIRTKPISKSNKKVYHTQISKVQPEEKEHEKETLLLSKIISHLPASILITDSEGVIKYANPYTRKITGYSLHEIVGNTPAMFKSGKMNQEVYADLWKTIKKGEPYEYTFCNTRKDGSLYWERTQIIPLKDNNGNVIEFLKLSIDITSLKETEIQREAEFKKNKNLLKVISDIVWQTDKNGNYIYVSDNAETILGLKSDDIIGKTPFDLMPPHEAAEAFKAFSKVESKKAPFRNLENTVITKEGKKKILLTNGIPVFDENGEHAGYFGVDTDITDKKQQQNKLQLQASLINQAGEAMIVTDANFRIIFVNQAFEHIYGYNKEEVLGLKPDMFNVDPDKEIQKRIYKAARNERSINIKTINKRKDGTKIKVRLSVSPYYSQDNELLGFLSVNSDITKEVFYENQLIEGEKYTALGTISGSIAHEFNNILQIVQTNTEVIKALHNNPHKIETYADAIQQAYQRGQHIVNLMTEYSNHEHINKEPVKAYSFLYQTKPIIETITGIKSKLSIKKINNPTLKINKNQMEKAIIQLVQNANESITSNGKIIVSVSDKQPDFSMNEMQRWACISIKDNGKGIPAENQKRVFDLFYTTKEVNQGLGVGLNIAQKIVNQHDGTIQIDSQPGHGTNVEIYLPVES